MAWEGGREGTRAFPGLLSPLRARSGPHARPSTGFPGAAAEAPEKTQEAAGANRVSAEPALPLAGDRPAVVRGLRGTGLPRTHFQPVPESVPDRRWTCGSHTPCLALPVASQQASPEPRPFLPAPPPCAGNPPRRGLLANQGATWRATNLCPSAARERGKSWVRWSRAGCWDHGHLFGVQGT